MITLAVIVARVDTPDPGRGALAARPLARLRGRSVLEWAVRRLQSTRRVHRVLAAVGDWDRDQAVVEEARRLGLDVLAGHPDSVLDRLDLAARKEKTDHVVRVNGNFPLVDPAAMDRLIEAHLADGADLSQNSHYHGLMYGLGVDVFSARALERIAATPRSAAEKKIGSLYLHHHSDRFRILLPPAAKAAPHLRVSVESADDLALLEVILEHLPEPDNDRIIDFLASRPGLTAGQARVAPAEVSLEKVLLFPEKVQALRRNNCQTFDDTYPISVELSLTNQCNHACLWCSDAGLRRRLPGEMALDTLSALFEDLHARGARGVVIEGGGEPTLHPQFDTVTRQARELGLALGLITNGYVPLSRPRDFEWIRVSLDASTRDQYRRLKKVDGFERVIGNLMNLAAVRAGTTLGVGYVLTNLNDDLAALERLVLFLRKIGVSYIHIRPVVDHPELVSRADLGFLKKYENDRFSVNLAALEDNREAGNSGLPCLAHSLSTVIAADGSVFLCGRLNRHETWEPIGHLDRESFHEIWTGRRRREQVGMVSKAEFCRVNCPQCRMTKYNRLLSDVERIKTRNFI